MSVTRFLQIACLATAAVAAAAFAQPAALDKPHLPGIGPGYKTETPPMMQSFETDGRLRWDVDPAWTVGERVSGYLPLGIPDGMGAMKLDDRTVRVFLNHEVRDEQGYPYTLANGTELTGGRISHFDFDGITRKLLGAGLAYDTIVDRYGDVVTAASQINEGRGNVASDGIDRLCSASLFEAGTYGLVDDVFMAGEETGNGQEFVLDARGGVLYAAPAIGRAAFENVTFVDTGDENTVGVLVGDDRQGAPLLLYVGEKGAVGDGGFLDRNGLARGRLLVWVADDGSRSPQDWNGTGAVLSGEFVEIAYFDAAKAGAPGYDAQGYVIQGLQDSLVNAEGGFRFSRPEDVATNPQDGTQAVLASTGRRSAFPADNWGTTYLVDLEFGSTITAELTILYDGDDAGAGRFAGPDYGLRSPDNLDWADDGMIYIQEDRSTSPSSDFGGTSGIEASLWKLDPATGELSRVLVMDRRAVPAGQTDRVPGDLGNWESSGVVDVTNLFQTSRHEVLLMATVQAHGLRDGIIATGNLVQGGQVFFLSNRHGLQKPQGGNKGLASGGGALLPARPNPFNPMTTLAFSLQRAGAVKLQVFNSRGQLVRTLVDASVGAGVHSVVWDGRDSRGHGVASGVYFGRLTSGSGTQHQRMTLLK